MLSQRVQRIILEKICDLASPGHNLLHHIRRPRHFNESKISAIIGTPDIRFSVDMKPPTNFWYSTMCTDNWSWLTWCNENMPDVIDFATNEFISFRIAEECYGNLNTPSPAWKGKVLKLDTEADFRAFHEKYNYGGIPLREYTDEQTEIMLALKPFKLENFIDWSHVQQDGWYGLEIIPYQEKYRMAMPFRDWYYPWD